MRIRFTLLVLVAIASSIPIVAAQEQQGQDQQARVQRFLQLRQQRRQTKQGEGQSGIAAGHSPVGKEESRVDSADASSSAQPKVVATANDIAYGTAERQKLDVYAPPKGTVGAPVVLFAHGGGWAIGNKNQHAVKGSTYAKHGVLFVCTNYQLAPNVMHPKQIQDIASAFAWVKAHAKGYGGDPNKIYVMGHSAGAQLVDLLATNDKYLAEKGLKLSDVKGCISLDTASLNLKDRSSLPGQATASVSQMVENAFGKDPKVLADASPMLNLIKGKKYPPFLMIASSYRRDSKVAHYEFEKAVREVGGTITTTYVPLDHKGVNKAAGTEGTDVFKQCLAFIGAK